MTQSVDEVKTWSDDEDEILTMLLESEEKVIELAVMGVVDEVDESNPKRLRLKEQIEDGSSSSSSQPSSNFIPSRIQSGIFTKIYPELFPHILKFLSSEDLVACSLVCRFLNYAASDDPLWRRLYCMRWGLLPATYNLRESVWKKLYIERDKDDMIELLTNCSLEFKEYYIQMQVAKRSQAPLPSQARDDQLVPGEKTVADQVLIWKNRRGLTDKVVTDHACSGETCSYHQIGDAFVCEKTGHVHVCGDMCRDVIMDSSNELFVCTISGRCFDRLLSPHEIAPDYDQQQGGGTDEAEPFMGSGRFARAYLLGYNCNDEQELEDALRIC